MPTARKRALSNFLSSMVECTAEKRTVIPAIGKNKDRLYRDAYFCYNLSNLVR